MKTLLLLAWIFATLGFSACNTTRGVGQDVEATGDAIEDTAEDSMDKQDDDEDQDY